MKQRRIAISLLVLLCATALLSGSLLILHAEHQCNQDTCLVCAILEHNAEFSLSLLLVFASIGFLEKTEKRWMYAFSENLFMPDWTPVRQKVKLQD